MRACFEKIRPVAEYAAQRFRVVVVSRHYVIGSCQRIQQLAQAPVFFGGAAVAEIACRDHQIRGGGVDVRDAVDEACVKLARLRVAWPAYVKIANLGDAQTGEPRSDTLI